MKNPKLTVILAVMLNLFFLQCISAQAPPVLWSKSYGGNQEDRVTSIQKTSDGGYIAAGYTKSFGSGGFDGWLFKISPTGDVLWSKTYGGQQDDKIYSFQETSDGGYILAGRTEWLINRYDTKTSAWLIKTNSVGDTLWTKTAQFKSGVFNSVWETSGGDYVMSYIIDIIFSPGFVGGIAKVDALGNLLWEKFVGVDHDHGIVWPSEVQETRDGGFVVVAHKHWTTLESRSWLMKINSEGDSLWSEMLGGDGKNILVSVCQTPNNGYILGGSNTKGGIDGWIIRLGQPDSEDGPDETNEIPQKYELYQNYPNPFNSSTNICYDLPEAAQITLKVYNILSQEVRTLVNEYQTSGEKSVVWDGRNDSGETMGSGIFVYRIQAERQVLSRKMLLLR